jgi:uncharacterized RmlC-like cupin family protein
MTDEPAHRHAETTDWKLHGVKVIPGDQLDANTAQSPGMNRAAARPARITTARWRA